ncbi:MBL fold metallo-hydrolase, partial [Pseudomonas viridiflava]|uniref:MBL fold metallo-hydrolase n=1 Tax=Pseudomonas viridiflava TaxID=33069 RepID=UPI00197ED52E
EQRYTALHQIRQLGFRAEDVCHIGLTHLDFDHAGGLQDFPQASVHVMRDEMSAASNAAGWRDSRRIRARQWQRVNDWKLYDTDGERWNGFGAVRMLLG